MNKRKLNFKITFEGDEKEVLAQFEQFIVQAQQKKQIDKRIKQITLEIATEDLLITYMQQHPKIQVGPYQLEYLHVEGVKITTSQQEHFLIKTSQELAQAQVGFQVCAITGQPIDTGYVAQTMYYSKEGMQRKYGEGNWQVKNNMVYLKTPEGWKKSKIQTWQNHLQQEQEADSIYEKLTKPHKALKKHLPVLKSR